MHLNVFTQCSPSPQLPGLWRHAEDRTAAGYRTLEHWTSMARRLEAASIDALFLADSHGTFDVYRRSWAPAVRHAVQVPAIDPVLAVVAAAAVTTHLGFAVTYSTTYHAPFECARAFSSLDHLTNGRIAWNIVTSFLKSAADNGLGDELSHGERYDRADEYIAVVRALWERSWEDGAVLRDAERDVFTDPDRVHAINHVGRWFSVRGPHQCEPSPQRTPVLYQAGASGRGTDFAARHAEVVFVTVPEPRACAPIVSELHRKAATHGRDPETMKILQGVLLVVARTREEARAKGALMSALLSAEGEFAKWSGWTGFDLAGYADAVPLDEIPSEASKSALGLLRRSDPARAWTVGDLRSFVAMAARPHRRNSLIGTPEQVADRMEEWMTIGGVDGFNLMPCPPSSGVDDLCDLLIPELQRRGLFRRRYDTSETTLRERYFGAGRRAYGPWEQQLAGVTL